MSKKYMVIAGNGKTEQIYEVPQSALGAIQPLRIQVQKAAQYRLLGINEEGQTIKGPLEGVKVKRIGKDMHLFFDDDQTVDVVLSDYFADTQATLVGMGQDERLHEYIASDSSSTHTLNTLPEGADPLQVAFGDDQGDSAAALAVLGASTGLGGLVALAGAGLLAVTGGGGSGGGSGGGTTPPATPTLAPSGYKDNVGAIQSDASIAATTDDTTPGVQVGKGLTNTPSLYVDGQKVPATYDSLTGTLTPNSPLGEGSHTITYTLTDAAGNESGQSPGFKLTVDTTAPATPVAAPGSYADNVGGVQSATSTLKYTDDTTPGVQVGKSLTDTPSLYVDGQKVSATYDPLTGTLTPNSPLGEGSHTITYTLTDAAGNESGQSPGLMLTVDTVAPGTPVAAPGSYADNVGSVQSVASTQAYTDDATPGIQVGAGLTDTPSLYVDGVKVAATYDPVAGTLTPSAALSEGLHRFAYTLTDAAGNESGRSAELVITVDTTVPGDILNGGVELLDDVGAIVGTIAKGGVTDDSRPTYRGTADATQVDHVDVYDNGVKIGSALVQSNGSWSFEPTLPLSTGAHSFTAKAVDAAGNASVGSTTPWAFTLLGSAPATPAITSVMDDASGVQKPLGKGDTTNDTTPVISGTGSVGTMVEVFINGVLVGQTAVAANGTWSFTPATPLSGDGLKNIAAQAVDAAGQTSAKTGDYGIVLDTAAPAKPGVVSVHDDVGTVGPVANGGGTDDASPTFSGAGEPGAKVSLYDNGTLLGTTTVGADGQWSFTPATPLTQGQHSITSTQTDAAGNTSAASDPFTFTLDTSQVIVTVSKVIDNQGTVTGDVATGGVSDDTTPTLVGTAPANALVTVKEGTQVLGTVTADGLGNWSLTLGVQSAGVHQYVAQSTNVAGNTGSAGFELTIDTAAPNTPSIGAIADDVGSVQGVLGNGQSTDDTTPTLSGTGASAGDTIKVYDGGQLLGSTQVKADGSWSYTPTTPLSEGVHGFTVTATDLVGNESGQSAARSITVDTVAPGTPVAAPGSYADNVGSVQSVASTQAYTDDATPGIQVGAGLTDTPSLYVDGVKVAATYDPVAGTLTPSAALSEGLHRFAYTLTDAAGNESGRSAELVITVDTTVPGDILNGGVELLDDVGAIVGTIAKGGVTDDSRPTYRGTADATQVDHVDVYDNGVKIGSALVQSNGSWSFEPTLPLSTGAHSFTAKAVDAAGNASVGSTTPWAFTLLGSAPATPAITSVMDDASGVQKPLGKGDTTNDTTPVISGTGSVGTMVEVFINGVLVGQTAVAANGTWSFTPATPLSGDGLKNIAAQAVDAAGQTSAKTGDYGIVLDTAAPAKPGVVSVHDDVGTVGPVANGGGTDDASPTFSGAGEPGAKVSLYDNGTLLGTTTVGADGQWSFTPATPLTQGQHSITSTQTDAAGNTSAASDPFTFTLDTSQVIVTVSKVIDNQGTVTGDVATGGVSDDTTPTLVGTAPANALVTVKEGTQVLGTVTADGLGNWSLTLGVQSAGVHQYVAQSTNVAGNTGSAGFELTIDTAAPNTPSIGAIADDVGSVQGVLGNGQSTDDTTPTLSGTGASAGDTIKVYDGGQLLGSTQVKADGSWSYTPTTPLSEGVHGFTVTATDLVGNESGQSAARSITVDTVAPGTPVAAPGSYADNVGSVQSVASTQAYTDDATPGIQVGAGLTDTPSLYVDGVKVAATYDPVAGTLTPSAALSEGLHRFAYTLTDAAGNESGRSAELVITVDTTVPGDILNGGVELLDDVGAIVGTIAKGGVTDDSRPTYRGTADATQVDHVDVYDNGVKIGSALVQSNGSWSFEPTLPLSTGAHSFTAKAVDAAGNASVGSTTPWAFTLLGSAPATPAITSVMDDASGVQKPLGKGDTTNDTTPVISGTGSVGTMVEVFINGVLVGQTAVAANGTWSFTPATPLSGDGLKNIAAQAVDAAGQTSAKTGDYGIVLDTAAPAKPGVVSVHDDVGTVGPVANGGGTDDASPTFSGAGEPGAKVSLYDNGTLLGTTTVGADGQWSFTPATPLTQGQHSITSTQTDAAGNTSAASDPFTFTLDTSQVIVTVSKVIDNQGTVTGDVATGGVSDDTTPTLVGTAPANALVTVKEGTQVLGTVTADGLGNWSLTLGVQSAGVHQYVAQSTNVAGNTGSAGFELTIDTAAPNTPSIGAIADDVGSVQGVLGNGQSTDDTTPTLSGTGASAGDTIKVYDGGQLLGSTQVKADGSWSYTPTTPLSEGVHGFTVTATDLVGNESGQSAARSITVDTVAPGTPVAAPGSYADNVGSVQSVASTQAYTDDATPGIQVGAGLTDTPSLYVDGVKVAATYDPVAGTLTPSAALSEGLHRFAYTLTDAAGNESGRSAELVITVDTTVPGDILNGGVELLDDVGAIVGTIAKGGVTDDSRPTYRGTADATQVDHVDVYDNGVKIGSALVQSNGSWSFEPTLPLSTGAHSFTAKAVDAAGNASVGSTTPWAFTLLGSAPATPAITSVMDDASGVQKPLGKGDTTNDTTPVISGTGSVGTMVEVFINGVLVGQTAVAANGTWSFTPATPLSGDGLKNIAAQAVDAAGQTSAKTGDYGIVLDTAAPAKPGVVSVHDDVGTVGPVANGGGTDDASPTFSGAGEPGAKVSLYDNGTLLGTTTVGADGQWSFTPATPLTQGQHSITSTQTDAAGNTSAASDPFTFTLDTSQVIVTVSKVIDNQGTVTGDVATGGVSDDTTPTLVGTAPANALVTVKEGTQVLGTVTADGLGNWSLTLGVQSAGVHQYVAQSTNVAGNTGSAGFELTIDTAAPNTPSIGAIADDVGSVQGVLGNGQSTDDTTPTLSGTGASAGDTIKVYDGGQLLGSTQVKADGSWSYTPTTPLSEGVHGFTVTATDLVGNESGQSAARSITVDTVAPGTPTLSFTDTGSSVSDGITNNGTVLVSGLEGGTTAWQYSTDGGGSWTTGSGSSFTLAAGIYGANMIQVRQADQAGNTSAIGQIASAVTVDTSVAAPTLSFTDTGRSASDGITNNGTITVSGLEVGAAWQYTSNGGASWTNGTGSSFTLTAGNYADGNVGVRQTDLAGNTSGVGKISGALSIDTTAPTTPGSVPTYVDNVGDLQSSTSTASSTDDTTPGLNVGTNLTDTPTLYVNGVKVAASYDPVAGTLTPNSPLGLATYTLSYTLTDAAGNESGPSPARTLSITQPVVSGGSGNGNLIWVGSVGDINADGFDDYAVTDETNDFSFSKLYVLFGNASGTLPTLSDAASGTKGFQVVADRPFYDGGAFRHVTNVGDLNGDGINDIAVTAVYSDYANLYGTPTYIIYGKTSIGTVYTSDLLNGVGGYRYSVPLTPGGSAQINGNCGIGDFNGDGYADYAIGSYGTSTVQVRYGGPNGASGGGFTVKGSGVNGGLVFEVAAVGDVNGDGYADIYVGGAVDAAIIYGAATTPSTVNLPKVNGFLISPNNPYNTAKVGAGLGDVNGDGLADMGFIDSTNTARVLFGSASTSNVDLANLGTRGFTVNFSAHQYLLRDPTMASAGDVNGDGLADFLIFSSHILNDDTSYKGDLYVVFGKADNTTVDLADVANGQGGYLLPGSIDYGYYGLNPTALGDFNGDGLADFGFGSDLGRYYMVLGGASGTGGATFVDQMGTTGDDTLSSTGTQTLTGGLGNDTLIALGADVLLGGAGNDTFVLGTTTTAALQASLGAGGNMGQLATVGGGNGLDTVRLAGGASLDLTRVANSSVATPELNSRISSIERIDLATDTAANTLTLSALDVKDMGGFNLIHTGSTSADGKTWTNVSGSALSATTAYHQLVVEGGSNDVLTIKSSTGSWSNVGVVSDGTSQYSVYLNATNTTQVIVKSGVTVNLNVTPVVIDLDGDGQLAYGQTLMDVNGDGALDQTAWVGPQDGVLVRDANHDGRVSGLAEFAFARQAGETDLQGLAALYDSNRDGVLNAQDDLFAEFGVWQDSNRNGVSDAGEVRSLGDWGIAAIGLHSDGVSSDPAAGVSEAGRTTVQLQDGRTLLAADAAFTLQSGAVWQSAPGVFSVHETGISLDLANLRAVAGPGVNEVDLSGAGNNTLQLQIEDVLSQPLKVDGQAGDVLQLFTGGESVAASSTTLDGVAYRSYDFNHDGQLELLVQQSIAMQLH